MIGKQVKGTSFRGVLNYLHSKEEARLIGGNMVGQTPRTLAAEFRCARELNPKLKKAVYHASLSLPQSERLDDASWRAIADDYVKGMGFAGSQYVVYRHADKDHDHIHIVASRIRFTDGSTVSDSWDYRRSEELIRALEERYQLEAVRPSYELDRRSLKTGEWRQEERTGEIGTRVQLQAHIDEAAADQPAMPELINRLKDQGTDAQIVLTRTGKIKGIKYQTNQQWFSGTQLGKAYTFKGLGKHRGVQYRPEHREALIAACARTPLTPKEVSQLKEQQQQERVEAVAPVLAVYLDQIVRNPNHEGEKYAVSWQPPMLTLTEKESQQLILRAVWRQQKGWIDLGSNLSVEQVNYFTGQVKPRIEAILQGEREQAAQKKQREYGGWER